MNKKFGVAFVLGLEDDQIMNHLTREFTQGFLDLGYNAQAIRHGDLKNMQEYADRLSEMNCRLIISLAGLGQDHIQAVQKDHGFDAPVVTMLMDPAILYWPRVVSNLKNNYVTTLSESDAGFVRAQTSHLKGSFTLNHATNVREVIDWSEKDIGLFYCGAMRNPPEQTRKSWETDYKPAITRMLNDMLDSHKASGYKDLMKDVTLVLNHYKAPYSSDIFRQFYGNVDHYLRDFHRVETVKKIMQDAPIILAGGGWDQVVDVDHENVDYLGRIHPEEVVTYNKRSKMVLNAINTYHDSHERVFAAMASGAAIISSTSPFYQHHFSADEGLFFDWTDLNLGAQVKNLLDQDDQLHALAMKGHHACMAAHTWKHRAKQLLSQIEMT